ncbi:tetraacyldisaccharide 4'-kinase [Endozoicomonadaceae bacterium StTr2]
MKQIEQLILRGWYQGAWWIILLAPLGWLTAFVARRRYHKYLAERDNQYRPPVPVVVVGNITVGGTGKTPFVAALVAQLKQQGLAPGIISRGYGSQTEQYPRLVTAADDASEAGDEPLMLARMTGVPVVIDPNRLQGLKYLLESQSCDVVISDDGLQHYGLPRDLEIVVLDGERQLGNGRCLPAGPLREPAEKLRQVDWCVTNGVAPGWNGVPVQQMTLCAGELVSLQTGQNQSADQLQKQYGTAHAVAGIGNPERFFRGLEQAGWTIIRHPFPDHHAYDPSDLAFGDELPVIMTEKDAVKCHHFAASKGLENSWYLPVEARFEADFMQTLTGQIMNLVQQKQSKSFENRDC